MDDYGMIKTTIELTKLIPSEGMVLTDGEAYGEKVVYLGKNDSPDNWHEITIEEYNEIIKKQEGDDKI